MKPINEQIEEYRQIVAGAPKGATHYAPNMPYFAYNNSGNWMWYEPNVLGGFCWFTAEGFKLKYTSDFQSLDTLRQIIDLHDENQELRDAVKHIGNMFDMDDGTVKASENLGYAIDEAWELLK